MESVMEEENKFFQMGLSMKVTGEIIPQMEKEDWSMRMGTATKGTQKTFWNILSKTNNVVQDAII